MRAVEEGIALLCAQLDDAQAQPLTTAQYIRLCRRVNAQRAVGTAAPQGELTLPALTKLGYSEAEAGQILYLLSRSDRLRAYLSDAERHGIAISTRVSPDYPKRLRAAMGLRCPPLLFLRGNAALLQTRCIALVGSRELAPENRAFAEHIGSLAAHEGYTLVSGNAAGADRAAQLACLRAGGNIICFVADALQNVTSPQPSARVLLCSESCFRAAFTPARALSRNHLIHAMGEKSFVAQVRYGKGGSWAGSCENLRYGYSPLFVFDDGSAGAKALMQRGATGIFPPECLADARPAQLSFLD